MQPKFVHDCSRCQFLGHYAGHDVYICNPIDGPSLVARFGNEGPDYASSTLEIFQNQIRQNGSIAGSSMRPILFQDYLFSDALIPYHKAWMLALAVHGQIAYARADAAQSV